MKARRDHMTRMQTFPNEVTSWGSWRSAARASWICVVREAHSCRPCKRVVDRPPRPRQSSYENQIG
eukprot:639491-Lingulodinium_polyedra.AAC.1